MGIFKKIDNSSGTACTLYIAYYLSIIIIIPSEQRAHYIVYYLSIIIIIPPEQRAHYTSCISLSIIIIIPLEQRVHYTSCILFL